MFKGNPNSYYYPIRIDVIDAYYSTSTLSQGKTNIDLRTDIPYKIHRKISAFFSFFSFFLL